MPRISPIRDQITKFLHRELANGPMRVVDIQSRSVDEELNWTTVDATARSMMIQRKQSSGGGWLWSLPAKTQTTTPNIGTHELKRMWSTYADMKQHLHAKGLTNDPMISAILSTCDAELNQLIAQSSDVDTKGWRETGHVCRVCLGPVMLRKQNGRRIAKCVACGAQAEGGYKQVCACGTKRAKGQDAFLRCVPNPFLSPERPKLVVVQCAENEIKTARKRERRPTDCTADAHQTNLIDQVPHDLPNP